MSLQGSLLDYTALEFSLIEKGRKFTASEFIDLVGSDVINLVIDPRNWVKGTNERLKKPVITSSAFNASTGPIKIELYEDVSYAEGSGTLIPGYDVNRKTARSPYTIIRQDPAGVDLGSATRLEGRMIPSNVAAGNRGESGQIGNDIEFIMDESKVYLLRLTNTSAVAGLLSFDFEFYEP